MLTNSDGISYIRHRLIYSAIGLVVFWLGVHGAHALTTDGDLVVSSDTTFDEETTINGNLTLTNEAILIVDGDFQIIVTGDVSVEAGTAITADGKGYGASSGPGAGGTNSAAGGAGAGGGHGGRGGGASGSTGGLYNGSGLLPDDLGSGGGNGTRIGGGAGGGVIRIAAGGTFTLDGTITTDGNSTSNHGDGGIGGGGAGGSIRIKCGTFAGSGLLRANGGNGGIDTTGFYPNYGNGSGGGGGRIVVRAKTSSFTNKAGAQAEGGSGGAGAGPAGSAGGRGTVAFIRIDAGATTTVDDSKADDLDLELYRSWRWEPAVEGSFDYEKVLVRADTQVVGGGGDATIDTNLFELENSSWDTTVESTNGFATASDVTINTVDMVVTDSTIEMGNSNQWTVNSTTSYDQSGGSANAQKFDINGSADLSFSDTTVTAQFIEIDGNSLAISDSGTFSGDARGHGSNAGPDAGGAGTNGGGGGHGGTGGNGRSASNGGSFNDSSFVPELLGSGGGNGARSAGGTGGGAVKIDVVGTFRLDGTITCNAGTGGDNTHGALGGGGAGGSILGTCGSFVGSGLLRANGARGGQDASTGGNEDGGGGGGGGGRIVISYLDSTFSSKSSARVDGGSASGGFNPGVAGQVGTIGFLDRDDNTLEVYEGWRWEEQDRPFLFNQLSSHRLSNNLGALIRGGTTSAFNVDVIGAVSLDVGTVWSADGQDLVLDSSTLSANSTTFSFSGQSLEILSELLASYTSCTLTTADLTVRGAHHSFTGGSASGTNFVTRDMGEWSLHGGSSFDFQGYDVRCQTLNQDVGTNIGADARGHGSNAGGAKGGASTNGGGGGHGGRGGNGRNAANAGIFNDSGLLPDDFGSGGGSGTRSAGGVGGGLIRIVASGLARVDGTISSNGSNGGDNTHGALGGGGAGGTIRIKCATFAGGGLLQAEGARGGQDASTGGNEDGGGGGGGGGRIVVRSKSTTFSNEAGAEVSGGSASGGFNPGSAGGSGTVAFIRIAGSAVTTVDNTKSDDLDLRLYRSWRWEPAVEVSFNYEKVTINPSTSVVAGGGDVTISAGLFEVQESSWDTTVESTNGFAATSNVTINATDVSVTDSTLDSKNVFDADGRNWIFNLSSSYTQTGGSLTGVRNAFNGAADLSFSATTVTGQEIFIAGNTLSVSADATLTTDARGHAADAGGAAGGASTNGGGGGHGGRGGNGRSASNAGGFNDSTLLPNDFGGGGGSGLRSSGGRGGGRILAALAGLCEIDGTLSSNGAQGGDNTHGALGGGGAGGTIRIKCEIFDGSGLLRANGARGGQDASVGGNEDGGGGGGGGGRIVVRSKSSSFTNKAGVQAEPGGASGGFNPGSAGGRGTVVFIRIDAGATTTVDDSKADDLDLEVYRSWRWEPAVEGSFDYEKVLVSADTRVVGGGGDATINAPFFKLESSSWDTTVESTNGFATASDVTINTGDMMVTGSTIEMGNSNQWTVNSTTSYEQSGGSVNAQKFDINGSADSSFSDTTVTAQFIEIDGNSLAISDSGTFSGDARGHGSNAGPGGGGAATNGGGGGHGGTGGNGRSASNGGAVNDPSPPTDHRLTAPVDLGSGGGSGSRSAGGSGGGLVRVNVVNKFQADGTVSNDGGNGGDNSHGALGGGGAGGSIHVTAGELAGGGVFHAKGARGGRDATSVGNEDGGGGGGGGGRLFFCVSSSSSWSGQPMTELDTAFVAGGSASGGFNPGSAGAVGTIVFCGLESVPMISPAVSDLSLADGEAITYDLTPHETDVEDGPASDSNALTWAVVGADPALFAFDLDPATEELTITPNDAVTPWAVVLGLTLTDSDGNSDMQYIAVTHGVSAFQLDLVALPSTIDADGVSTSSIEAKVSSLLGNPVEGKTINFTIVSGGGLLSAVSAATGADGVASVTFNADIQPGSTRIRANHVLPGGVLEDEVIVIQQDTELDPSIATGPPDISFHDPVTGAEIFPGDGDTVLVGEIIEVRVKVTNIGGLTTPAGVEVELFDSFVGFGPLGVSSPSLLTTLTLPALNPIGDPIDPAPGSSAVVSFETAFFDNGFHELTGIVDPPGVVIEQNEEDNVGGIVSPTGMAVEQNADNDVGGTVDSTGVVTEQNEGNNESVQGFWIGPVESGFEGDNLIVTECSLEAAGGRFVGAIPAAHPGEAVLVSGRADYLPFISFDPDHSLGLSAMKRAIVSLSVTDILGNPVEIFSGETQVMPATAGLGQFRALYTIGSVSGVDKSPLGHYPNRSEDDKWAFPAPSALGRYTLRVCVSDTSFEGCSEVQFEVIPRGSDLACTPPTLPSSGGAEVALQFGLQTQVSSSVMNLGDNDVSDVVVRFLVNGVQEVADLIVPSVAAGAAVPVSFDWVPECGDEEVTIQIDPADTIAEQFESNSQCSRQTITLATSTCAELQAKLFEKFCTELGTGSVVSFDRMWELIEVFLLQCFDGVTICDDSGPAPEANEACQEAIREQIADLINGQAGDGP